jgi:hypothetical protein
MMGINLTTERVKVGDKLVVTRDGRTNLMEVYSIDPAGSMGRREPAGPRIGAWIRPGGYSVTFDYSTAGLAVRLLGPEECEEFVADGSCIHSDHTR